MSNYEQTKSEKFNSRSNTTRSEVSSTINDRIASAQRRKATEEKMAERVNRIGNFNTRTATLIIMGSEDRVKAVPYNPNKFESRYDQSI